VRLRAWAVCTDGFSEAASHLIVRAVRENNVQITSGLGQVQVNDDMVEFPRTIRSWSRHAQNESYEGLNVLVWLMDEASAFLSKLRRENASGIYQTLKTSAASRFGRRWGHGHQLSAPCGRLHDSLAPASVTLDMLTSSV
jgi:hypothetical protein